MVTLRRAGLRFRAWRWTASSTENAFRVQTGFTEVVVAFLASGQSGGNAITGPVAGTGSQPSGFILDDYYNVGIVQVSGIMPSDTGGVLAFGLHGGS